MNVNQWDRCIHASCNSVPREISLSVLPRKITDTDYKSYNVINILLCIRIDSMHASGNTNTEMRELQDILKDDELSLSEKQ